MKTKTLIILLIILGVLAGAGALIFRQKAPERSLGRMGTQLLEQLPVNKIVSIAIEDSEHTVLLEKKEDGWVVKNRFSYPADFDKISDFVRDLKKIKIGRQFESSEDTLKRLSLKEPNDNEASSDEKGILIHFKGKGETSLAHILLGKTRMVGDERSFPDGQYLKMKKDSNIYLVDKHFSYLESNPTSWLDKRLINADANEVKKISCRSTDGKKVHYIFERAEKERDLEPVNLTIEGKIDRSALNRLADAISNLTMEDVINPKAHPVINDENDYTLFDYHLYNGLIYRVYICQRCSDDEDCYLKIKVDYQKPAEVKGEKPRDEKATAQKAVSGKTPQEYMVEAKSLNARLSPWIYKMSKRQHNAFVTDPAQLLEKPKTDQKEKD